MSKSKRLLRIIFSFFILSNGIIKGQQFDDGLKKREFDVIEKSINKTRDKNQAFEESKRYIALSKLYNESDLLYSGYILAAQNSPESVALKYCDSVILHTVKTKNSRYIGLSYSAAAAISLKSLEYKKSAEYATISDEYLKNDTSKEFAYDGLISIGKLKYSVGDFHGASKIWHDVYEYYSWKITQKNNAENLSLLQYSLAELIKTNAALKKNSANQKLLLKAYSLKNDENSLVNFYIADAINDFEQNKNQQALNKFIKASHIKIPYQTDRALLIDFYIASCYYRLKNIDSALPLFLTVTAKFEKSGKTDLSFRPAFNFFTEYYKKNGTTEQQLTSLNDLLEFDKYEKDVKSFVQIKLKDFDEKRKNEEKPLSEEEGKPENFLSTIILALSAIGILYFGYRKIKANEKSDIPKHFKVQKPLAVIPVQQNTEEKKIQNSAEIDYSLYRPINKLTVDQILASMKNFETSLGFLEQDIKLTALAQNFNTNEKYLSKVIKIKLGKTFNTYLTDLRFEYIDEKLKTDSQFKNQKIKEISYKSGFGSPEFFATAFKEKYGKSPKEYFER